MSSPERKLCILLVITTIIIVLITVVTGIVVRFTLDEVTSRYILIGLITFLCVVFLIVLIVTLLQKQRSLKMQKNATEKLHNDYANLNMQQMPPFPSQDSVYDRPSPYRNNNFNNYNA